MNFTHIQTSCHADANRSEDADVDRDREFSTDTQLDVVTTEVVAGEGRGVLDVSLHSGTLSHAGTQVCFSSLIFFSIQRMT